ncbi:MAG: aminoacyl-tRNA hydrolase [Myxococcota bacterium]
MVVGLGNPGPKYAANRHNVGFMVASELARRAGASFREKFNGSFARCRLAQQDVVLLEPMTYMNRSGTSVGAAGAFFKIPPEETIVVHDDLDLPFGCLRVKKGGGHGGHNGLRSIFQHFGKDFVRVRVGVDRPRGGDVTGWVLSDFGSEERIDLPRYVDAAADAVEQVLREGPERAMNAYNGVDSVV